MKWSTAVFGLTAVPTVARTSIVPALCAGEETVHVLHGHGSGALKSAIREHLSRSPYVAKARGAQSHEGGDGVTVVTLRG